MDPDTVIVDKFNISFIVIFHGNNYVLTIKIKIELLTELAKRERDAGIFPEAEVDLFMKVMKNKK